MTEPESRGQMPRWLRVYLRAWYWLTVPLTVGWFVMAGLADVKFYVILFSAVGGATLAFLFQSVAVRLYVARRRGRGG